MKKGVLQIIDSLDAGGAEKIAVIIANHLQSNSFNSFLVATRKEGKLKSLIKEDIGYCFPEKKSSLDIKSILRLRKYVKKNNITIIHAHATSIFTAVLLKLITPRIKIVWHDHYGNSEFLEKRNSLFLKVCSLFVSQIIAVNKELERWSLKKLYCKNVMMLKNASILASGDEKTKLKGIKGKRITMLAGLRPQKDHLTAIRAFEIVIKQHPDTSLHFFGTNFNDHYSENIFNYIETKNLSSSIFYYGVKTDIKNILEQSDIGILSSNSEGLPLTLIEYGLAGLPIAASNVGDSIEVVGDDKFIVESGDVSGLAEIVINLLNSPSLMHEESQRIHKRVKDKYGIDFFMKTISNIYNSL